MRSTRPADERNRPAVPSSAPGAFYSALEQIREARLALQLGNEAQADVHAEAARTLLQPAMGATPPVLDVGRYAGARVVDTEGRIIGEVVAAGDDALELALGGWRDAWGCVDFSTGRRVHVPVRSLAFGPPRVVGMTLVAVPSGHTATAAP